MSSQIWKSRLVNRPLIDLTDQIVRDSAIHIAGGAYGDVYKCRCNNTTGSSFLSLRHFDSDDFEENQRKLSLNNKILRRELGIWRRLEHPNIAPLLGVTEDFGPMLAAVLPWMSNGTLHSFLKNKGQMLAMEERLQLLLGIVSGLEYLHSNRVLHGDLHSGNVLIDEEHHPRISDFGLSSTIGRLQPGLSYLQRLSDTSNVGAVRWAAPERLSGCKPHPSGDVYSFGCIMFEVLSGDVPWKEKNNYQVIALKLEAHKPPSRPNHLAVEDEHWALMASAELHSAWRHNEGRSPEKALQVKILTVNLPAGSCVRAVCHVDPAEHDDVRDFDPPFTETPCAPLGVIELGSGTGVVAARFVVATDLSDVCSLLRHNLTPRRRERAAPSRTRCCRWSADVRSLGWGNRDHAAAIANELGVYLPESFGPLLRALVHLTAWPCLPSSEQPVKIVIPYKIRSLAKEAPFRSAFGLWFLFQPILSRRRVRPVESDIAPLDELGPWRQLAACEDANRTFVFVGRRRAESIA